MNYGRIVIAGVVATVVYFLVGGMVAGKGVGEILFAVHGRVQAAIGDCGIFSD